MREKVGVGEGEGGRRRRRFKVMEDKGGGV